MHISLVLGHRSFATLVECNMKQMRIGTCHLVSIDKKIEYSNFTADTDCMLLLLFLFLANYLFSLHLLIRDMAL